jgi:hypothetical protein
MIRRYPNLIGNALWALVAVVLGLVLAVAASEWYVRQCLRTLIRLLSI